MAKGSELYVHVHTMYRIIHCVVHCSFWLQPGLKRVRYNCPSADQQRETDTASDLTLFRCLTESGQVFHKTDNTANDWSDWGNYMDRSGVQTIIQHLLTVAMNEHD